MSTDRVKWSAVAVVFLLAAAGHGAYSQQKTAGDRKVAAGGGVTITEDDLAKSVASELEKLESQHRQNEIHYARGRHLVRQRGLESLLEEKLFAAEVAKQGISMQELLAREVNAKAQAPSEQEIDTFYEANKSRIGQTKERVAPQVRKFLEQQAHAGAKRAYLHRLMKENGVTVDLEPLRLEVDTEGYPSRGSADAPVTILEFSDFECVHCRRLSETLAQVSGEFGSRLRVVFRNYPLDKTHPNSRKAAEAALCAAEQNRFWEMHDAMFADQANLKVEQLKTKAGALNLDQQAFDSCLDSGRHAETLKKDLQMGAMLGLSGTSALFVNGRVVAGALPYEQLVQIINEELKPGSAATALLR